MTREEALAEVLSVSKIVLELKKERKIATADVVASGLRQEIIESVERGSSQMTVASLVRYLDFLGCRLVVEEWRRST